MMEQTQEGGGAVAPRARSKMRRSMDMEAGMVSMSLYPLAAAMNARPIPVLPLVGSTSVVLPALHTHGPSP